MQYITYVKLQKYHEEAELTCSCIISMFPWWRFHCSLSDSLKEDEEMLRAVLHEDHVRENFAIILLINHMVRKRVLLTSLKSYVYICTYVRTHILWTLRTLVRKAQMFRGHMLLMSLYEVFACVSLPFLTSTVCMFSVRYMSLLRGILYRIQ